jgi:hypothetical protein
MIVTGDGRHRPGLKSAGRVGAKVRSGQKILNFPNGPWLSL